MANTFYISDLHFGHKNIVLYDDRPFSTVFEMDDKIIENWNSRVHSEDTVYILGDISWYPDALTSKIFSSLKGNKILIKGNHDNISSVVVSRCFKRICDYLEIYDGNKKIVLSHYPTPFWNGQFRNSIHLYGHVHNSHQWHIFESFRQSLQDLQDIPMLAINVGCMMEWMDYTPRTLQEILDGYKTYLERK